MQFFVTITHSQINVFDSSTPDFNLWSDEHVAQGFAWRAGHVSFGTPDHDGRSLVMAEVVSSFAPLTPDVLRAIRVPMTVATKLYVATIIDDVPLDISAGTYELEYRLRKGIAEGENKCALIVEFSFMEKAVGDFAILARSGEMTADQILTKTAKPAT